MPFSARFAALARAPEGSVRLAEAALWIAAVEYPDLDVAAWLRRLDILGERAARRITPAMDAAESAQALNRLLFEEEGFRGNVEAYEDPRNSCLNEVLVRRLGIPISLSVVYIEVAAAAGVTVRGVGLPGHFVVRLERSGQERLLDPFHGGRPLDPAGCHALVRRIHGPDVAFDPAYLRPVTTREIVARMLANLRGAYLRRGDVPRALGAADRLVLLRGEAPAERRDRGLIHARAGHLLAAIHDLEAYLLAVPAAADAEGVRGELRALRHSLAVLN